MARFNDIRPRLGRPLRCFGALAAAGLLSFAAHDAEAQQLRFSTTAPGGIAATGNTLGLSKAGGVNGPGIHDSIGTFISLDSSSYDDEPFVETNPWPAGTTYDWTQNGSTAVLVLPDRSEVLYAELVWSGSYYYDPEDVSAFLDDAVVLTVGGESIDVSPDGATAQTFEETSYTGFAANYYIRSADVTAFISQQGGGTYSVSGVPATQNTAIDSLSAAGWTLVVAYRQAAQPIRNLSVFVGGSFVDEDAQQDYTVTGFCAPPFGAVEGKAVVSALEGDADLAGDDLAIGETAGSLDFVSLLGPNNPESNFFCSQINDGNGDLDTSGSFGGDNHDAASGVNVIGGRQGWDLTTVALSSSLGHLVNDQQSAVMRTTTTGDSFVPTLVALELDVKSPDFSDSSTEASVDVVQVGDTFNVSATLANSGEAQASNLLFALDLDDGLALTSYSTDGTAGDSDGATVDAARLEAGVPAGTLMVSEMRTIELTVEVVGVPENGTAFTFRPTWGHSFQTCSNQPAIDESFSGPGDTVTYEGESTSGAGGSSSSGSASGGSSGNPDDGGDPRDPAGCACSTPGTQGDLGGAGALALLGLALAATRRRRR
jgi:MYXO-CTERM domain-containing protein